MDINIDVGLGEVLDMEPGPEKAAQLAVYGLTTDGAHHKQWYLEQILTALSVDLDTVRRQCEELEIGDWEPGIAP